MPYDNQGNWDYSAAATEKMFRRRGNAENRARFLARVGAVVVMLLVIAGLIGFAVSGWYVQGRPMGAGVRDALEQGKSTR